jgi:hypothetical protein
MSGKLTRDERLALQAAVTSYTEGGERRQRALARAWNKVLEWHRPKDAEKVTWRLEFLVSVEADALDEIDAIAVAENAADWPGNWHPSRTVPVHGSLNGKTVHATLTRSRCIAITRKDRNAPTD